MERIGSDDDNAISDGLAKALYSFIRDLECFSESSVDSEIHSWQPHLDDISKKKNQNYELFTNFIILCRYVATFNN